MWFSQTGEASCSCPFTSSIYIYAYFTLGAFIFGWGDIMGSGLPCSPHLKSPIFSVKTLQSSGLVANLQSSKEAIFSSLLSSNLRYLLSYKTSFFTKANLQASWKPGCPLLGQDAWFYLVLVDTYILLACLTTITPTTNNGIQLPVFFRQGKIPKQPKASIR